MPAGTACTALTITETLVAGAAGTAVTETFAAGGGTAVALASVPTVLVSAPTTTISLLGCQSFATGAASTAFVVGGTLLTTAGPGATVTCRIDLSDAGVGALGATVASGIVTVSLSGSTTAIVGAPALSSPGGGPASVLGATSSIRCGAAGSGPAVPEGCDFVDVTFTTTATTALGSLGTLNVSYVSDLPSINTNAQTAFVNFFTLVISSAALVGPSAIGFACTSSSTSIFSGLVGGGFSTSIPTIQPGVTQFNQFGLGSFGGSGFGNAFGVGFGTFGTFPSGLGASGLSGVGILPESVRCAAVPLNAAGIATTVAPGTIEVSSVAGVLVDASGRLSTNLRIGCGSGVFGSGLGSIGGLTSINLNSCQGVQFAVLGQGVGIVDIRARYEPAPGAAGLNEVEGVTAVGFVAPTVSISLAVDPNPVTVGATGTATARFNRTGLCGLGVSVTTSELCINPTTGLPILINLGSALNGTVIFTIEDTATASFTNAVPTASALAPSAGTIGFTTSSNTATVRCGGFPSTTTAAAINQPGLANFFGGCESVSAPFRGNNPGVTNVSATFLPDLPGAFGSTLSGLGANAASLLGAFGTSTSGLVGTAATSTRGLSVVGAAPSGVVQLTRGCNNVTPTVSESASAYAARVTPGGALVSIFEYQAATNTFRGFSPQAGAPSDLASVTFLRPVFVCTNAAATLDQPPVAGPGGVSAGASTR